MTVEREIDGEEEGMTAAEMQRFLNLMAEEGKDELEAYRSLTRVLGVVYPSMAE